MASIRRRSHIGDAINALGRRRSDPHATTSVREGTGRVDAVQGEEGTESVDKGSSRPGSPLGRATQGFCKNCGSNIGEYFNLWHKITSSYYMPAMLGSYRSLLKVSGKQKAASKGTHLEGW